MRVWYAVAVVVGVALVTGAAMAAPARPLDRQLALLDRIDRSISASQGGDPSAMQERYEAARELAESVRLRQIPAGCEPLAASLEQLAASEIALTQAFDRLRPWRSQEARSRRAQAAISRNRSTCTSGGRILTPPHVATLTVPGPGEAFFGWVEGRAPARATRVLVNVNGTRSGSGLVVASRYSTMVQARAGSVLVEALFIDERGVQVGAAVSRDAWLLPPSAAKQPARPRRDHALSARFSAIGLGFDGYAAVHFLDLGSGVTGGWNDDARFPAASTVKLAVMLEAARKYGLGPASPVAFDVEQIGAWSSNLAANRLLKLVGNGNADRGVRTVTDRLRALGATASTYPGEYRAGTAHTNAPRQPPLQTTRVTTARDLASVLRAIHLAATGNRAARSKTGLSAGRARAVLRSLLASQPQGDNAGLVRGSIAKTTPLAQKHGWLSDTRATAAIVYRPAGPAILVVMGYRPGGLSLAQAQKLGARVTHTAGLD